MAPAPAAAAMAGGGCTGEEGGGEEDARVPGEAWGWETLGEEGKAEQSRAGEGRKSSFLEHARGRSRDENESEGRETEVVVDKATAFAPEPGL